MFKKKGMQLKARMIPSGDIRASRVLCLAWKSSSKTKTCKRGFVFEKGMFLVGITKGTQLLRSISKRKEVEVRINGGSQRCRPKIVDEFEYTKAFTKKEIERLIGKKLSPSSGSAQKLDGIAARHVVLQLKPIRK